MRKAGKAHSPCDMIKVKHTGPCDVIKVEHITRGVVKSEAHWLSKMDDSGVATAFVTFKMLSGVVSVSY